MPFEELKVRNKFARQRKHLEAALHAAKNDADGDSDNGLPAMPSAAAAAAPAAPQTVDTRKGAHAKQTSAGKSFYDVYFSSDATMDEFQQEREQKLRQFAVSPRASERAVGVAFMSVDYKRVIYLIYINFIYYCFF